MNLPYHELVYTGLLTTYINGSPLQKRREYTGRVEGKAMIIIERGDPRLNRNSEGPKI